MQPGSFGPPQEGFHPRSPVQVHVHCQWRSVNKHPLTWPQTPTHTKHDHQWAGHQELSCWKESNRARHLVRCCMLKELHEELSPFFTALFRNSNESGNLPEVWKSSWVSPVFKKGTKCDMANYRPLSLTWVACKLLEHILCSHIRNHLQTHYALSLYQHGFRKRLSCESQLLTTTHDLLPRLNHMDEVGILDFSKAFDVVPYQRLMQKLRLYGIEGRTSNWISIFC